MNIVRKTLESKLRCTESHLKYVITSNKIYYMNKNNNNKTIFKSFTDIFSLVVNYKYMLETHKR